MSERAALGGPQAMGLGGPRTGRGSAVSSDKEIRRTTIAASVGTFVEFYDFGIYGVLAVVLAGLFFPPGNSTTSLLLTWGVYALSFAARPLGGVVGGVFADRLGRKPALILVFSMMAAATALIGVLPTYSTIGVAAPILLLALRLIQGFSTGGEVASAWTFIAEFAPSGRRGRMTSWGQSGSTLGLLLGSSLALVLTQTVDAHGMQTWGWRIPFLLAAPMGLIGLYVRRRLDESPAYAAAIAASGPTSPLRESFTQRRHIVGMLLAFIVPMMNVGGYYTLLTYMPTYLAHFRKLSPVESYGLLCANLIALFVALPVAGRLSDRFGRRPVVLVSTVGVAALCFPYYAILGTGSLALAIVCGMVMSALFAGNFGVISVLLVEMFPARVRATAASIGSNVGNAIFGGAAPLLLTYLISHTGNELWPAWYLVLAAVVTAVSVTLWVRETAHEPMAQ